MFRFLSRLFVRKAKRPSRPHCQLIEQARWLVAHGYYVGAVATARCALESRLKDSVQALGNDRPDGWHGNAVAMFLHRQGLLTLSQARRVSAAVHISASMVRGPGHCPPVKSARTVREIEAVIALLESAPRDAISAAPLAAVMLIAFGVNACQAGHATATRQAAPPHRSATVAAETMAEHLRHGELARTPVAAKAFAHRLSTAMDPNRYGLLIGILNGAAIYAAIGVGIYLCL